jgi:hypothetical protein
MKYLSTGDEARAHEQRYHATTHYQQHHLPNRASPDLELAGLWRDNRRNRPLANGSRDQKKSKIILVNQVMWINFDAVNAIEILSTRPLLSNT